MEKDIKRYYIIFRGRVQGVGFRFTASQIANNLGLTGWVRNLANGDVDCEIQGNSADVTKFLRQILRNDRYIHVEDYSCRQIETKDAQKADRGRFVSKGY